MIFYVGFDNLTHAKHFERSFISVNAIRERKSDFEVNGWILDSGAFTTVSTLGGYPEEPEVYAAKINRWMRCGSMYCAASQDYMCEPFILAITGLTVRDHQRLTIERYDRIRRAANAYVMPVLQGFLLSEYLEHLDQYGDRLNVGMRVGIGSVCKRNSSVRQVEEIVLGIKDAAPNLKLHGFGLKTTALESHWVWDSLFSADSMAWSEAARIKRREAEKKHGMTTAELRASGLFTMEMDCHDWRNAKRFEAKIIGQHRSRRPIQREMLIA